MSEQPYPYKRQKWGLPPEFVESLLGRPSEIPKLAEQDETLEFWEVAETFGPAGRYDVGHALLRRGPDELNVSVIDLRTHGWCEHQEYPDPVAVHPDAVAQARQVAELVAQPEVAAALKQHAARMLPEDEEEHDPEVKRQAIQIATLDNLAGSALDKLPDSIEAPKPDLPQPAGGWAKATSKELDAYLEQRGLPTSGKKAAKVARLEKFTER